MPVAQQPDHRAGTQAGGTQQAKSTEQDQNRLGDGLLAAGEGFSFAGEPYGGTGRGSPVGGDECRISQLVDHKDRPTPSGLE